MPTNNLRRWIGVAAELGINERLVPTWLKRRELNVYPQGWFQIGLLVVVVVANIVANYEGQLAPVVPLLLPYLHLSTVDYGFIVAGTTVVSGIVAILAGSRIDRYGRSIFVVAGTFITSLAVFSMVLVHNSLDFFIVRFIMAITLGIIAPASSGLVRDFTPRFGRAFAYGFWTFGPVGANFLAAGIAGATLPLFHDAWQSQFIIMGSITLILSVLVAIFIRDMSPELRAQIIHNREEALRAHERAKQIREVRADPRLVYGAFNIWALSVGITLFLLVYFFTAAFGPLYLVTAFKYPAPLAASIASYFWLANLGSLLLAGWVSDRLQLRKPVSMFGVLALFVFMYFWIHLLGHPVAPGAMVLYTSLQGIFLGIGYGPWLALFSENVEDVHPALQATGWSIWGFTINLLAAVAGSVTFIVVDAHGYAAWLDICWAGVVAYGILIFFGKGPWFRREPVPMTGQASSVSG
jgi:MFS family permease